MRLRKHILSLLSVECLLEFNKLLFELLIREELDVDDALIMSPTDMEKLGQILPRAGRGELKRTGRGILNNT